MLDLEGYTSQKTHGWEERLIGFIGSCSRSSFRPGQLDCALFFAHGMAAVTNLDLTIGYLGEYRTLADGYRLLKTNGYEDHIDYFCHHFPTLPSPLYATRGDGAVVEDENGHPAMGIVQGEFIYVMGMHGVGLVPLTAATKAVRV